MPRDPVALDGTRRPLRLKGGAAVDAERLQVAVPSRWTEVAGPDMGLEVLRLLSPSAGTAPPLIVLAGGPGMSGIHDLDDEWPVDHAWLRRALEGRDVIVFDQRGTGSSTPSTDCGLRWDLELGRAGERAWMLEAAIDLARRCKDGCESRGVDLGAFTTHESVGDIAAIADALGIDSFSLLGASYGTHLGLAAVRELGERVDRAIFALVEPLDHTYKLPSSVDATLGLVTELIASDARWRSLLPDLRAQLEDVLGRLDAEVEASTGGRRIRLGRWDAQLAIALALGSAEEIAAIPGNVYRLLDGDFTWLAHTAAEWRTRSFDRAMAWHTDAASGATTTRLERIEREAGKTLLSDALTFPFPEMAAAWGNPDLGDSFRAPFESRTPVLFVSGALDARTPPSNVEEILGGFVNGAHLVVDGMAHDAVFDVDVVGDEALGFLEGREPTLERAAAPFTFEAP